MIASDRLDEALAALDNAASEGADADMWYLRGKAWWRKGEHGKAMSCYSQAVAIDPDSPAATALSQARDIAAFFNPDLLNP